MCRRFALPLSVILGVTFSIPARAEVPVCTASGTQDQVAVAPGDSSAVVVWRDNRNDPANPYDIFASRLDYYLNSLWSPFGDGADECAAAGSQTEPAVAIGPDGITWLSWRDYRTCSGGHVWVQGLAPDGSPLCQADGRLPITAPGCGTGDVWMLRHTIISTSAGTAVVAWHHAVHVTLSTYADQIRMQKLDAAGCALQWGNGGVLIHSYSHSGSTPGTAVPVVISDGAGGSIVVWSYGLTGPNVRLYAQRVNTAGTVVWGATVRICTTEVLQQNHSIAPDGSGGVIVTWEQGAVGARAILAQRIDASGVVQWGTCGKVIAGSGGGDLRNPQIVRSTLGRSFIIWEADYAPSNSDIFAQRINFLGDTLAARIPICTAPYGQTVPRAAAGPDGSCYIVWQDGRDLAIGDDADIFAQKLDASGTLQCQADGMRFAGLPENTGETIRQYDPRIVSVEIGGSTTVPGAHALVVWSDTRNGAPDIYACPMSDPCQPGVLAVGPRTADARIGITNFPNPFSRSTKIRFRLAQQSPVTLRVYDMSGRLVRVLAGSEHMEPGEHEVEWNGMTDTGNKATPGVYFYRLTTGMHTQAKRMVFLK